MKLEGPLVAAAVVFASFGAHAAVEGSVPAGGGLAAVTVKVDLAGNVLRFKACPVAPCAIDGAAAAIESRAIELAREELPDASAVRVEPVAVGEGRRVLRVVVPSKSRPVAWEALVGAEAGRAKVLHAAVTGFSRGEGGERTGAGLKVLPRDDGTHLVAVGSLREDLRICGQETLLAPSVLEPRSMRMRSAAVQRLPRAQREAAKRIVAGVHGGPADAPLGRLVVAVGASSALGKPGNLTDGDPTTAWSEARSGTGLGEFVVMRAAADVPIHRFQITVAPPGANPTSGAAPKSLFLVTDAETYAVTLPEDGWLSPGAAYDVPLPEPIKTGCVALVLDEAYARGNARPDVTVAEIAAFSEFDIAGAKPESLAKLLVGGGPRADAAASVLKRAGSGGVAAVVSAWDELDTAGRALAADVAVSAPCEEGAPILVRAFDDVDPIVERKGRDKLERCGRAVGPVLVAALSDTKTAHRAKVASLLAFIAPITGLGPLAAELGKGSPREKEAMRSAFTRAARSADPNRLIELLRARGGDAEARLELLRAMGPRVVDLRAEAQAAVMDLLKGEPPFRTRYLILGPMAELAREGDRALLDRFALALARDPEWAVRARAAELAIKIPGVQREVIQALDDAEPRARDAALHAVTEQRLSAAAVTVGSRLLNDPWTFVRVSAAGAMGAMPPSPDIDTTLGSALADPSPRVRVAILEALGVHRAQSQAPGVRERLERDKAPEVRTAAAGALAQMCDPGALDALTDLAGKLASPIDADEATLGLAAVDALGKIHPPDLERRLARLAAKGVRPVVQRAAQEALAGPGICRR